MQLRRQTQWRAPKMAALMALVASAILASPAYASSDKLNTLLIIIDDFRPEIATYGSSEVETPNMDAFAEEAVVFERVYPQQALCGPSRLSMLTGRSTNTLGYFQHLDRETELDLLEENSDFVSYFGDNGFYTQGTSKVTHFITNNQYIFDGYRQQATELDEESCGTQAICPVDKESDLTDYHGATFAINRIERFTKQKKQWFFVLGIRRPHLTWRMPTSVYEKHPASQTSIVSSSLKSKPQDAPWQAHALMCYDLLDSDEVAAEDFVDENDNVISNDLARTIRAGYFGSVEWVDDLVGRVLDVVDYNNTLIIITSDHGWSLGEHGAWCKSSLYDIALRVPLMIRDPRSTRTPGTREMRIVSHLDFFPTFAELANIPVSKAQTDKFELEGNSFADALRPNVITPDDVAEVIERVDSRAGRDWSYPLHSAFSANPVCADEYQLSARGITETQQGSLPCRICVWKNSGEEVGCGRCAADESKCSISLREIHFMGYSMRIKGYRYTEWRYFDNDSIIGDWTDAGLDATELYEHDDSQGGSLGDETDNLAVSASSKYASDIADYSAMLRAYFLRCDASSSLTAIGLADSDMDAESCAAIGDHCIYIGGACRSRSFCDFSGSDAETLCLERQNDDDAACTWDEESSECLIAEDARTRTINVPTMAPTGFPTKSPTLAPTGAPTERPTRYPTKSPTTPIPTEAPTVAPTFGPTSYSSFCNMVHLTNWWEEHDSASSCIESQIAKTAAASALEAACAAVSPDLDEDPVPKNTRKYWRWKKKYGRQCLAIAGCQYFEPLQKCVMNTCHNRNDKSCNIQDTGGRCVWYKRKNKVRGGDSKYMVGCFMNPCLLMSDLGAEDQCTDASDKKYTCTACERFGTCQIEDTFKTSSDCLPCTDTAECYADNDTAQTCFSSLSDPASCGWRKRSGTYWACNKCELKSCPNANNVLSKVTKCDTS
ncbi:Iduronate 2-sulfatase [Hondaea fermentalgiana]|uniref:Iduronate 2-sulfatase n=1 Tax=Hondaea fermentalgiana TaxID=2315210 RepID=A0A2R5GPR7_9STRA|nr:Iduronate 2-sulfatase [Hondaea fermentalgiana]|eukprot:GBG32299.1 Iduronate 2-sulfatase [Hondaea fermentalgiana]